MKKYDLEDRLIDFAVMSLNIVKQMPFTIGAKNLAGQLSRSCTSPALNYGEAQAAESDKDFLQKLKLCLKELRETQICLKIILRMEYLQKDKIAGTLNEVNQLVAIFQTSVNTKKTKMMGQV